MRVDYELEVLAEEISIFGNAMASGDDVFDRETEKRITDALNRGNEWAWCCIHVTASAGGLVGHDYLGACSYRDEKEFRGGGYYADMIAVARADLLRQLAAANAAYLELKEVK